ncbi:MAG: outer membrane protein assembly factor BamD [Burkholderiales bacterium PBB4]|nr:MAG: outer membrane protein assembly factor BamD [Burkholderiales bacterium PBB4]
MLRVKLSVVSIPLLAACAMVFSGCSTTTEDKTVGLSPAKIYSEAKDEMSSGQWERAILLLEKLEARAAGTPLAQQAQLDKAYAQYKASETEQALATIERFKKLHPVSPAMDYALYLQGLVTFNDDMGLFSGITKQDLSERDQKASKESFEAFKELVARFPDSKYAPDAQQRMNYIVSSLAKYEVHVARYYLKRGAYLAAINRAQATVSDFRDVEAVEEALFILYKSYDALGLNTLRDDSKRVLEKSFPQSEFLVSGAKVSKDPWWRFW